MGYRIKVIIRYTRKGDGGQSNEIESGPLVGQDRWAVSGQAMNFVLENDEGHPRGHRPGGRHGVREGQDDRHHRALERHRGLQDLRARRLDRDRPGPGLKEGRMFSIATVRTGDSTLTYAFRGDAETTGAAGKTALCAVIMLLPAGSPGPRACLRWSSRSTTSATDLPRPPTRKETP